MELPITFPVKDVNGNLTNLKLCFAIKTEEKHLLPKKKRLSIRETNIMQYLPVLNALPVGLIANSKNSSAPLINPDSFISDTTKNGGGMNIP